MKNRGFLFWTAFLLIAPSAVHAETISAIDALYERGMQENYHQEGHDLLAESLDACVTSLTASPASYDLLWRCARSAVELAETAKILQAPDWNNVCISLGKKGIAWCNTAQQIAPDSVEGYFWQLQAMSLIYEEGGVFLFLGMGLPAQSKRNIDTCIRIDPSYLDYTPILAKALYYYNLPPILGQDLKQALAGYNEFERLTHWRFESYRQYSNAAAMLISMKDTQRARNLLLAAVADPTPRPYYYETATKLLSTLQKSSR
jgi:hypothetical protein